MRSTFQKGQTAVLVTITLVALLGMVSLGTDVAVLYFNWVQLQKAADASVLAGAHYLPGNPTLAESTASDYASNNGVLKAEILSDSTVNGSNNMELAMEVKRTVPYYFARVVGLLTGSVAAGATAEIQADSTGSRGLIPIGLPCNGTDPTTTCINPATGVEVQPGDSLILKAACDGTNPSCAWTIGPGNWAPLALGGNGGSIYQENLDLGYLGSISVGDIVNTETGQLVGPTRTGIDDRVTLGTAMDGSYTSGVPSPPPAYDPRLVIAPLINYNYANGKSPVPVIGFAQIWINGWIQGGQSGKSISATFIQFLPNLQTVGGTSDVGSLRTWLVQ